MGLVIPAAEIVKVWLGKTVANFEIFTKNTLEVIRILACGFSLCKPVTVNLGGGLPSIRS